MIGGFLVLFPIPTLAALAVFLVILSISRNWDAGWAAGFIVLIVLVYLSGEGWLRVLYTLLLIPTVGLRKLLQILARRRLGAG
jgi:hypothetical protein